MSIESSMLEDESLTSANLGNNYGFIIKEYSLHCYEAFWGSPAQSHESLCSKWTISYHYRDSYSSNTQMSFRTDYLSLYSLVRALEGRSEVHQVIPQQGLIIFKIWVWSWLRRNASYMLNIAKSNIIFGELGRRKRGS